MSLDEIGSDDSMLERFADAADARQAIEEFLDWLPTAGHQSPRFRLGNTQSNALDEFFLIDRARLERERQALLEIYREPAP